MRQSINRTLQINKSVDFGGPLSFSEALFEFDPDVRQSFEFSGPGGTSLEGAFVADLYFDLVYDLAIADFGSANLDLTTEFGFDIAGELSNDGMIDINTDAKAVGDSKLEVQSTSAFAASLFSRYGPFELGFKDLVAKGWFDQEYNISGLLDFTSIDSPLTSKITWLELGLSGDTADSDDTENSNGTDNSDDESIDFSGLKFDWKFPRSQRAEEGVEDGRLAVTTEDEIASLDLSIFQLLGRVPQLAFLKALAPETQKFEDKRFGVELGYEVDATILDLVAAGILKLEQDFALNNLAEVSFLIDGREVESGKIGDAFSIAPPVGSMDRGIVNGQIIVDPKPNLSSQLKLVPGFDLGFDFPSIEVSVKADTKLGFGTEASFGASIDEVEGWDGSLFNFDFAEFNIGDRFQENVYEGKPFIVPFEFEIPEIDDGPPAGSATDLADGNGARIGSFVLEAPTYVADGDADFTLSLAGLGSGIQFNIAYIIDVSGSMGGSEIRDARDAYVELTNELRDRGIADAASFAVIPFNSSARSFAPLDSDEAIERIEGLSAGGGTRFTQALNLADEFFAGSGENQTNVAYFLSDGRGSGASDALTGVANVQAFALGSSADLNALNIIDSDNAERLNSSDQLAEVLTGAGIDAADVGRIEVFLDDTLVETVRGDQLVDGPLGLQYTGTISGLQSGGSTENEIRAVAYLDDGTEAGTADLTVGSAFQTEIAAVDDDGVQNVSLGAFENSFDLDQLNAQRFDLKSNQGDNEISVTQGSGQIRLYNGDDIVSRGNQANSTDDVAIDGGPGFDLVTYLGSIDTYKLEKLGNITKIGANTDTLTNVEIVKFDDAFLDTDTFDVTPNEAPVAVNDVFSVDEDIILDGDVLADNGNGEDSDPNTGDLLTASLVDSPASGNLTFAEDGTFTYAPETDFNGTDQFTYRLSDGSLESEVATAKINVTPINDAPRFSASAYTLSVREDAIVGALVGTLDADDIDGDELSFVPKNMFDGSFSLDPASGEIMTTSSLDYEAQQSYGPIEVTVSDDTASPETDRTNLTIELIDVNEAPAANADAYELAENGELSVASNSGVLANDVDPEGADLEAELVDDVADGTLALDAAGGFTYTPDADFNGTDSFTYRARDGALESTVVSATITVTPSAPPKTLVVGTVGNDVLVGTEGDDLFKPVGGSLNTLTGMGGADVFEFRDFIGNGTRDVANVLDFEIGVDSLGLNEGTIAASRTFAGNTYLNLAGDENDMVVLRGVDSTDELMFA